VGLERGKQRLLVMIRKVVAKSISVNHVGRKNGPQTRFSDRPLPWRDELGNGNTVHLEVQLEYEFRRLGDRV